MTPLVRMDGIHKHFPGVHANRGISLTIQPGEVHAVLGENGAGKTVLMNILFGVYAPEAGQILVQERPMRFRSPRDAIAQGIGMVHQHFTLVPTLTVLENVLLGQRPGLAPLPNGREAASRLIRLGETYGMAVRPEARVETLSIGEQQRVEILKALNRDARLLILDEPTAVLTPPETARLLAHLRDWARRGVSILFISHKLSEVMQVSDRVTVLRDGQVQAALATADTTPQELAAWMIGREPASEAEPPAAKPAPGPVVLTARQLRAIDSHGRLLLRDVSLDIRAGEVVGVAGAAGSGQTELVLGLAGLRPLAGGAIALNGQSIEKLTPGARSRLGLAHIPEDRVGMGLLPSFTVAENLILHDYGRGPFSRAGWLQTALIDRHARRLMDRFAVRAPQPDTPVQHLSGGNQQKVVLARELERRPVCLLANQPTRGMDVQATRFVLAAIAAQRAAGAAVLWVSSDLEELLAVSDRIVVMYEGRVMGERPARRSALNDLGLMMAGQSAP